MDSKKIIIGVVVIMLVALLYSCKKGEKENMTGGFDVISGLSMYNNAQRCYPGNSAGSSSPFCENPSYVLF